MGMRASTGAIWRVIPGEGGGLHCEVLGDVEPRGICGSGLVDAVASGLTIGAISPTGRLLPAGQDLVLADPVVLTQPDVRQLQLAKGAIAAGIRILLNQWGSTIGEVSQVLLAGAFGNYIDRESASRIGLLAFPSDRVFASGKQPCSAQRSRYARRTTITPSTHCAPGLRTSLNADPQFQDIYVDEMSYPE